MTPTAGAVVSSEELAASEAKREAPLVENLRKLREDAVGPYEKAVEAMDAGDHAGAEKLLDEVHHEVPGFTAATRRLCLVKGALGKRAEALTLCREAAGDGSARSQAALSFALTGFGDVAFEASAEERREAMDVAEKAVSRDAQDVLAQRAVCLAARSLGDARRMRACSHVLSRIDTKESVAKMWMAQAGVILATESRATEPNTVSLDEAAYVAKQAAKHTGDTVSTSFVLAEVAVLRSDTEALGKEVEALRAGAPDDVRTSYFETVYALAQGDPGRARTALARARELGLDEGTASALEEQIDAADPTGRWLPILGGVLLVSAGGMALLQLRKRQRGSA